MSIRDVIKTRVAAGELFLIEPEMPSDPVKRTMVASAEVYRLLAGPWQSPAMWRRCARLQAQLEAFIKGDPIGLCLTPYKHEDAYLGRLDKPTDEVWDIRGRNPEPGLRVFGRFADKDLFVALLCAPRSVEIPWLDRKPLGDRNSMEWHYAIIECQQQWKTLFPEHDPIRGGNIHDYVSENVFAV